MTDFALSDKISGLYGNDDGTTFTMPLLSNFVRLNGILQESPELTSFMRGQNSLPSHLHNIYVNATGKITVVGQASYSKSVDTSGTIHWGTGTVTVNNATANITDLSNRNNNTYDVKMVREYFSIPKVLKNNTDVQKAVNWIKKHIYESNEITLNCSCDVNVENIAIENAYNSFEETYPDYFDVPVMVYVGKKQR